MQSNEKTDENVTLPVSLRDWFAGQCLPAVFEQHCVVAAFLGDKNQSEIAADAIAARCYRIADAMLEARKAENHA